MAPSKRACRMQCIYGSVGTEPIKSGRGMPKLQEAATVCQTRRRPEADHHPLNLSSVKRSLSWTGMSS